MISCRCRAEFCYVCGEPWKTCRCEQWNEDRLYARAAQIFDRGQQLAIEVPQPVDPLPVEERLVEDHEPDDFVNTRNARGADGEAPAPEIRTVDDLDLSRVRTPVYPRNNEVLEIADVLRRNHDCQMHRWQRIQGGSQCEVCFDHLPRFILRCSLCYLNICRRCRNNRL